MDPPINEPIASPIFPTAKIDSLFTFVGFQSDADWIPSQPIRDEKNIDLKTSLDLDKLNCVLLQVSH